MAHTISPQTPMSKKQDDLQSNEKASVNPFADTKKKSTEIQNPSRNIVSQHGNTTDGGSAGKEPRKTTPIRKNPMGNRPMSKDV